MSISSTGQTKARLGVGTIIGESFSILGKHFLAVVLLAFLPTLIGTIVSAALLGWGVLMGTAEPEVTSAAQAVIPALLAIALQVVIYCVATALLVQLAYDAKLARPLRPRAYFGPAMGAILPIAILGLVASLAVGIGFALLIIPGLWIWAVFSMVSPAIIIEKVGFGGLGRSAALTKDYRWPILGALIIMGIISGVITFITQFITGVVIASTGGGMGGILSFLLVNSFISAISIGLGCITTALIYARLREIKEGASVKDIAAVFD